MEVTAIWPIGHVLFGFVLFDLFRRRFSEEMNFYKLFAIFFFSMIPDVDLLFDLPSLIAFTPLYHGGFTHTVFFALFLIGLTYSGATFFFKENRNILTLACVIGLASHLIGDIFIGAGGIALFFPLSDIKTNLGIYTYLDNLDPRPQINFYQFFLINDIIVACGTFLYIMAQRSLKSEIPSYN
jgi:membrane-bound metal-dependent hydrolase YbcI (DUF457 family)